MNFDTHNWNELDLRAKWLKLGLNSKVFKFANWLEIMILGKEFVDENFTKVEEEINN